LPGAREETKCNRPPHEALRKRTRAWTVAARDCKAWKAVRAGANRGSSPLPRHGAMNSPGRGGSFCASAGMSTTSGNGRGWGNVENEMRRPCVDSGSRETLVHDEEEPTNARARWNTGMCPHRDGWTIQRRLLAAIRASLQQFVNWRIRHKAAARPLANQNVKAISGKEAAATSY
jgi:hypothetical protein